MPTMTAAQVLAYIRSLIEQVASWLYLLGSLLILALFLGTAAKATGHPIPYLPAIGWIELAYGAGAVWLLKR